jgi:hypothetical protein
MNWKGCRMEQLWPSFWYGPGISMEGSTKAMIKLAQYYHSLGKIFN